MFLIFNCDATTRKHLTTARAAKRKAEAVEKARSKAASDAAGSKNNSRKRLKTNNIIDDEASVRLMSMHSADTSAALEVGDICHEMETKLGYKMSAVTNRVDQLHTIIMTQNRMLHAMNSSLIAAGIIQVSSALPGPGELIRSKSIILVRRLYLTVSFESLSVTLVFTCFDLYFLTTGQCLYY